MANQWLTGSGVPSTGIGQVTDYYRDTASNLVYYRENAFTWTVVPAFTPNPDGIGTTWLHGDVPPLTGQGSDGDYYYDEVQLIVYRKDGATWVPKGSLDFIGIYGVQWGNGSGAPANTTPLNNLPAGSFYLNVETSDIYYKEPSMSWVLKGQLGGGGGGGGGGGSSVTVENVLNSNSTVNALSAAQGKALSEALANKCPLVEGKVPSENLPSYVDDALEFANLAAFPVTGVSGKIYIALNTNLIYRWTGSTYVLIGDGTGVDVVGVGASSFVRYDVAQTLSNDDKARVQTTLGMSIYALTSSLSSYLTTSTAASTYGTISQAKTEYLVLAASDESTALTTGTGKVTFRMPYAMTVSSVRASLSTAQASGSILTVDINDSGTTILSTKLTIDNTEKTSTTAATAAVISDTSLADDAEITIDIDQVGDGTAKGLKITLIGTRA